MVEINGKQVEYPSEIDLYSFLQENKFDPELVAVEVDRELVKRKDFKTFIVKDRMSIEVFSFIGGG